MKSIEKSIYDGYVIAKKGDAEWAKKYPTRKDFPEKTLKYVELLQNTARESAISDDNPSSQIAYQRGVISVLNDFVANLKKGLMELNDRDELLHDIYRYVKQFSDNKVCQKILKMLEKHFPAQVLPDDILKEIFERVCMISTRFPAMKGVSKSVKSVIDLFLSRENITIRGQHMIVENVNRCQRCEHVGLLVAHDESLSTCAENCLYYCENRDCESFGKEIRTVDHWGMRCIDCWKGSIKIKKRYGKIECQRNVSFTSKNSKCTRMVDGVETAKLHACEGCKKRCNLYIYNPAVHKYYIHEVGNLY